MAGYTDMGCKYGKKHMVFKATQKPMSGVKLDNRDYKFFRGNFFYMNDAGAAHEVEQEYGVGKGKPGDVVVIEKEFKEPGHNYRFAISQKDWKSEPSDNWEEYAPGKWRRKVQ
jgi:hypothetical protein